MWKGKILRLAHKASMSADVILQGSLQDVQLFSKEAQEKMIPTLPSATQTKDKKFIFQKNF